ncbi:MAG: hypothetical protein HY762_02725 [Planctomycetes bacterium]|nr:hypothetical protein [Planctomycetota bacterium]
MVNIAKITKKRLGELLIDDGLITNDQLQVALKEQQKTGGLLGETLVKLGAITEYDIAAALSTQFGLPYIDATHYTVNKEIFQLLPVEFMKQHQLVILDKISTIVTIAISGPLSEKVFEEIEKATKCKAFVFVSTVSQIKQVINSFGGK